MHPSDITLPPESLGQSDNQNSCTGEAGGEKGLGLLGQMLRQQIARLGEHLGFRAEALVMSQKCPHSLSAGHGPGETIGKYRWAEVGLWPRPCSALVACLSRL